MRNRYAKRKDISQKKIEKDLKKISLDFKDVSDVSKMGCDLLVFFMGITFYVEVKTKSHLTKAQKENLRLSLTDNERNVRDFCERAGIPYIICTDTVGLLMSIHGWLVAVNSPQLSALFLHYINDYKKEKSNA